MKELTSAQRNEIAEQFAELVVDRLDLECLMTMAEDHIIDYCGSLSDADLREEVNNEDDGLFDELVDSVTNGTPVIWGEETS